MGVEIIALICVVLINGFQAEVDIEARFNTLEAALQKDNVRIIKLEELVNKQQEMLKDQSLTINELRNLLNMQTVKLNEQADTIKQQDEILSAQLATVQLLQNEFNKYRTRNHETPDIHTPSNEPEISMKTISQPGSGIGAANQKTKDGQDHNKNVSADNNDVRARIVRGVPDIVAFTAIKMEDQTGIGVNQNILFDRVILNEGGAYHSQNGVFVAPASGYYLFATSLLHPSMHQQFHGGLMHNGNSIANAFGTNDIWAQASQTVVLKVTTGDEVWIKNLHFEHESVTGSAYSSFTGVLLFRL